MKVYYDISSNILKQFVIFFVMAAPQQDPEELKNFSIESLQINMRRANTFQTVIQIVGGIIAGVLGLTSWEGMMFFLGVSILITLALLIKMKFDPKVYLNMSSFNLFIQCSSNHVLSFILFWTMSYALVYIY